MAQYEFWDNPQYWLYSYRYFRDDGILFGPGFGVSANPDPDVDTEVFVMGETEKDGKRYRKLGYLVGHLWNIASRRDSLLVRWDEGRVYVDLDDLCRVVFSGDEAKLRSTYPCVGSEAVLYDFTLRSGDRFGCTHVRDVSDVTVGGTTRKMLTLASGHQVVEGIGSLSVGFFEYLNQPLWLPGFNGLCGWFLAYYNEDWQVVYRQGEKEAYDKLLMKVGELPLGDGVSREGATYDLEGRAVRQPIPGHVYIKDGRKFAVSKK